MKNHHARPQSQRPIQLAMINDTLPASSPRPGPMKSFGTTRGNCWPIDTTPAMVKPEGPMLINIPGLRLSCGSFCVMRR